MPLLLSDACCGAGMHYCRGNIIEGCTDEEYVAAEWTTADWMTVKWTTVKWTITWWAATQWTTAESPSYCFGIACYVAVYRCDTEINLSRSKKSFHITTIIIFMKNILLVHQKPSASLDHLYQHTTAKQLAWAAAEWAAAEWASAEWPAEEWTTAEWTATEWAAEERTAEEWAAEEWTAAEWAARK